jgi:hypothetical protein
VFDLAQDDELQLTYKVIQRLNLLLGEVALLKAQVDSGTYGKPERYSVTFDLIYGATNRVNFGAQWKENRQYLDRLASIYLDSFPT